MHCCGSTIHVTATACDSCSGPQTVLPSFHIWSGQGRRPNFLQCNWQHGFQGYMFLFEKAVHKIVMFCVCETGVSGLARCLGVAHCLVYCLRRVGISMWRRMVCVLSGR